MRLESVLQLLRDNPRTPDGYAQQVRDAVGRYAEERVSGGARWREVQAELGISTTSMRKWARAHARAQFHQVVVVSEPEEAVGGGGEGLTITTPAGFRLTGCTVEQAAVLLRRLR